MRNVSHGHVLRLYFPRQWGHGCEAKKEMSTTKMGDVSNNFVVSLSDVSKGFN